MIPHIAFYAPMKPPHHPIPSGDRRMARLLMKAVRHAGYSTELASALRCRNPQASRPVQTILESRAMAERARVLRRLQPNPPALWLTYHSYYKSPDLIGPWVSAELGIPYVLVEASYAPKRAHGPWRRGQALAWIGMAHADLILHPNPDDQDGIAQAFANPPSQTSLPPFLDLETLKGQIGMRAQKRQRLAQEFHLDPTRPWLVTTAMMRPGSKQASYAVLAEALAGLDSRRFALLVMGNGPAREAVAARFANLDCACFLGVQKEVAPILAASDIFVWPAIDEAFGLASLEAQAVGLPAVLGDRPGVRAMVRAGETALLTAEGDAEAFRGAVAALLEDPTRRRAMGQSALDHVAAHHGLEAAAAKLRRNFDSLGVARPCGLR